MSSHSHAVWFRLPEGCPTMEHGPSSTQQPLPGSGWSGQAYLVLQILLAIKALAKGDLCSLLKMPWWRLVRMVLRCFEMCQVTMGPCVYNFQNWTEEDRWGSSDGEAEVSSKFHNFGEVTSQSPKISPAQDPTGRFGWIKMRTRRRRAGGRTSSTLEAYYINHIISISYKMDFTKPLVLLLLGGVPFGRVLLDFSSGLEFWDFLLPCFSTASFADTAKKKCWWSFSTFRTASDVCAAPGIPNTGFRNTNPDGWSLFVSLQFSKIP